jgi:energy-coupling factor transporter ATP-binding protein EcfA2
MLTRLEIKNFKKLESASIELGQAVVLIGPNNSGKSTALQALALWVTGLKTWNAKRKGKTSPEKRPGVTINRRDLTAIPIPIANLLWHDLHTRDTEGQGKQKRTRNVLIEIRVEGVSKDRIWKCGMEFDLANEESIYCRPLRTKEDGLERMEVPEEAGLVDIAFLPPMSGLAATEPKWEPGRISVLLGEGQTAQVLRNLCYRIFASSEGEGKWTDLVEHIRRLFGIEILPPNFIAERGEITMEYREENRIKLDLSAAGRGMQQTLLLLAHLYSNPGSILLLDEPDAHLEIIRQRQIYNLLTEIAESQDSQVIAASHSEVVLREAAEKNVVVAFLGTRPHRIDDQGSQLIKSLRDIPFDHYYLAEEKGWILYLEGSTDLAILKALAEKLKHPSRECLTDPFVYYIGSNDPQKAKEHFFGLREANKKLRGIAIFDRLDRQLVEVDFLGQRSWKKREIENYLVQKDVLLRFAMAGIDTGRALDPNDFLDNAEIIDRRALMEESIQELEQALRTIGKVPWSDDIKASDDFLDPLFKNYYKRLNVPQLFKSSYHQLASQIEPHEIDDEISEKLDVIVQVAEVGLSVR